MGLTQCRIDIAIDHHPGTALLTAPGCAGDRLIDKQPLGYRNPAHMPFHLGEIGFSKRRTLRPGLDVSTQLIQVFGDVGFILTEELHHPRVRIPLLKTVLQGVFHHIADLLQPLRRPPFGTHRHNLKHRPDRYPVIEQQALAARQVLGPRQVIHKRRVVRVKCLFLGHRQLAGFHLRLTCQDRRIQAIVFCCCGSLFANFLLAK